MDPKAAAFGDGVFAIANGQDNSVSLIDKTGRRIATVSVGIADGSGPIGVTFGALLRE
jgi:YVTN family beta-propeller protein